MPKNKNDSYQTLLRTVERAAWRQFDGHSDAYGDFDTSVLHTFADAVVLMNTYSEKLYEASYLISDSTVVFSELKEVQEQYVSKRAKIAGIEIDINSVKSVSGSAELGGPIVKKNSAQRIAHAAVLVPGEPDSDGEEVTAEKIEEVAHGWMESYRNVDFMHTLNNTGVPVESYITPADMEVEAYGQKMMLPKGTWVLASKFTEETWGGVEDGTLRGYSVMGVRKSAFENAIKSKDENVDISYKRTLLRDLGPDWVATHVSIVDEPAVPKAKFFSIKSKNKEDENISNKNDSSEEKNDNSLFAKVTKFMDVLGLIPKKSTKKEENVDMAEKGENKEKTVDFNNIAETIANSVKSALEPINTQLAGFEESLNAVKTKVEAIEEKANKSKDEDSGEENDSTSEKSKNTDNDNQDNSGDNTNELNDEAFKTAIMDRLDKVESLISRKNTGSKGLVDTSNGDDSSKDNSPVSYKSYRDAFGRRLKDSKAV